MKRVTYLAGPFDDEYRQYPAYLIDRWNLMYVDEDGTLWLESVIAVDRKDDLYVTGKYGGIQLAANVERGEIVIREIYDKLAGMTALDFLTKILMQTALHIELELA